MTRPLICWLTVLWWNKFHHVDIEQRKSTDQCLGNCRLKFNRRVGTNLMPFLTKSSDEFFFSNSETKAALKKWVLEEYGRR